MKMKLLTLLISSALVGCGGSDGDSKPTPPVVEPEQPLIPLEPSKPVPTPEPDQPLIPLEPSTPVLPPKPEQPLIPLEPSTPVPTPEPDQPLIPLEPSTPVPDLDKPLTPLEPSTPLPTAPNDDVDEGMDDMFPLFPLEPGTTPPTTVCEEGSTDPECVNLDDGFTNPADPLEEFYELLGESSVEIGGTCLTYDCEIEDGKPVFKSPNFDFHPLDSVIVVHAYDDALGHEGANPDDYQVTEALYNTNTIDREVKFELLDSTISGTRLDVSVAYRFFMEDKEALLSGGFRPMVLVNGTFWAYTEQDNPSSEYTLMPLMAKFLKESPEREMTAEEFVTSLGIESEELGTELYSLATDYYKLGGQFMRNVKGEVYATHSGTRWFPLENTLESELAYQSHEDLIYGSYSLEYSNGEARVISSGPNNLLSVEQPMDQLSADLKNPSVTIDFDNRILNALSNLAEGQMEINAEIEMNHSDLEGPVKVAASNTLYDSVPESKALLDIMVKFYSETHTPNVVADIAKFFNAEEATIQEICDSASWECGYSLAEGNPVLKSAQNGYAAVTYDHTGKLFITQSGQITDGKLQDVTVTSCTLNGKDLGYVPVYVGRITEKPQYTDSVTLRWALKEVDKAYLMESDYYGDADKAFIDCTLDMVLDGTTQSNYKYQGMVSDKVTLQKWLDLTAK